MTLEFNLSIADDQYFSFDLENEGKYYIFFSVLETFELLLTKNNVLMNMLCMAEIYECTFVIGT